MPFAPSALAFLAFGWIVVFGLIIFVGYKWYTAKRKRKSETK